MRGYLRKDGRKGIRNVVVVTYLVECAHHVAARIAQHFQDEDVHLIGFSGCFARYPREWASCLADCHPGRRGHTSIHSKRHLRSG